MGMKEIQERLDQQTCSAKFTQEIKDTRAKENQRAKFEGHFTGNPMPEIVWEFDGKVLENSKEIEIKHSKNKTTLTFHEAKIEMGSDRTRAQLTVTKFSVEDAEKAEKKKTERRASKAKMAEAEKAKLEKLQAQQAAK